MPLEFILAQMLRQQFLIILVVFYQRQFFEDIPKIGIGLQAVGFGGFNQAEKCRTGMGAVRMAGKQPVFPPQNKRPDRVFHIIIVRLQAAVFDIDDQFFPVFERILDGFSQPEKASL